MNETELKELRQLLFSAGNGGYILDEKNNLCFDGDEVRIYSEENDGYVRAVLEYDKELRRWYVNYIDEKDAFHLQGETGPLDDMSIIKGAV